MCCVRQRYVVSKEQGREVFDVLSKLRAVIAGRAQIGNC